MRKHLGAIIIILLLLGGAAWGQARLGLFSKPCARPITYSLGTFDTQFGMTQDEFLKEIDTAVQVWERPSGLDLFNYDPNGKMKINLIYDYRQQATDELAELGIDIEGTQSSYESLKARYNSSLQDYYTLKQNLDAEIASYNKDKAAYEEEVHKWNSQGGAPRNVVSRLNSEREALNARAREINQDQNTLNSLASSVNSMADILNRMARELNLNVSLFNNIGASRGEEFEEGVFISSGGSKEINIYEFNTKEKLIRLLAHELGHAVGLEHIDSDPSAIMYRLNQNNNAEPTSADLDALKSLCKI